MGSITVGALQCILADHDLLREVVTPDGWVYRLTDPDELATSYEQLDYYSKNIKQPAIFLCKGAAFDEKYLYEAVERGAKYYIAEKDYPDVKATGFIVSDERRAMAAVAQAFYHFPDEKLQLIGITGTKGKTTVNYFIHHILQKAYPNQVGYLSTIDYCIDGKTRHESALTTPESVDLYRMLAEAVAHDLKYLVMEVSSQAYKLNRVYGLEFEQGLFLNFTPDHIGPLEHPTMEDYFYCKRQLLHHSKHVLLHDDLPHLDLLKAEAQAFGGTVATYGFSEQADFTVRPLADHAQNFQIFGRTREVPEIYESPLPGDFNQENAAAAIIIARYLDVTPELIKEGLAQVEVPGRMMEYHLANGAPVYIDYAHNYDSLRRLLDYVASEYPTRHIKLLIGATGNKGKSRRQGFAKAIEGRKLEVVFTADDPGTESPRAIAEEITAQIKQPLASIFIEDREQAIRTLLEEATAADVVVLAGKGTDTSQIIGKQHVPYSGDHVIVEQFIEMND